MLAAPAPCSSTSSTSLAMVGSPRLRSRRMDAGHTTTAFSAFPAPPCSRAKDAGSTSAALLLLLRLRAALSPLPPKGRQQQTTVL